MTKKYIVVKNKRGEFAPKNTETGTVFRKEKTFDEAKKWADIWNAEDAEKADVCADFWTPVDQKDAQ